MDYINQLTLKDLILHDNPIVRRNAISILKTLTRLYEQTQSTNNTN